MSIQELSISKYNDEFFMGIGENNFRILGKNPNNTKCLVGLNIKVSFLSNLSKLSIKVKKISPVSGLPNYYETHPKYFLFTFQFSYRIQKVINILSDPISIINFSDISNEERGMVEGNSKFLGVKYAIIPDTCKLRRCNKKTCYINSTIQSFFHLKKLRDVILSTDSSNSVFLAGLKELFRKMLVCSRITTIDCFTNSLGWPKIALEQPHDAAEFASKFLEKISSLLNKDEQTKFNKIFQFSLQQNNIVHNTYILNIPSNQTTYSAMLNDQKSSFVTIPEVLVVSFALNINSHLNFDLNASMQISHEGKHYVYQMVSIVAIQAHKSEIPHYSTLCRTSKENVWIYFNDDQDELIYNDRPLDMDPFSIVQTFLKNQGLAPTMVVYVRNEFIDEYLNTDDLTYPMPCSRIDDLTNTQRTLTIKISTEQDINDSIASESDEIISSISFELSNEKQNKDLYEAVSQKINCSDDFDLKNIRNGKPTNESVPKSSTAQLGYFHSSSCVHYYLEMNPNAQKTILSNTFPYYFVLFQFKQELYIRNMSLNYHSIANSANKMNETMFRFVSLISLKSTSTISSIQDKLKSNQITKPVYFYMQILDKDNKIVDYKKITTDAIFNEQIRNGGFIYMQYQDEFTKPRRPICQSKSTPQFNPPNANQLNRDQKHEEIQKDLLYFNLQAKLLKTEFVIEFPMIFHITHFSMPITFCQISSHRSKKMLVPYKYPIDFGIFAKIIQSFMEEQDIQLCKMVMYFAIKEERPLFPCITENKQMLSVIPNSIRNKSIGLSLNKQNIYLYYSYISQNDYAKFARIYFSEDSKTIKFVSKFIIEVETKVYDLIDLLPTIFQKDQTRSESKESSNDSKESSNESKESSNESKESSNESKESSNESKESSNESKELSNQLNIASNGNDDLSKESSKSSNETEDSLKSNVDSQKSDSEVKAATLNADDLIEKKDCEERTADVDDCKKDEDDYEIKIDLNDSNYKEKAKYKALLSKSQLSKIDQFNFFKIKFDQKCHFTDFYNVVSIVNNHFQYYPTDELNICHSSEIRIDRKCDDVKEFIKCFYGARYNQTQYIHNLGNPFRFEISNKVFEQNKDKEISKLESLHQIIEYDKEDYEILVVDGYSIEINHKNPTLEYVLNNKLMIVVCMKYYNAADFINEEKFFADIRFLNN